MRNDEEFKKEVFRRWELKESLEKMRRRRALGSLCVFLTVCIFAVPALLNMNISPESNNIGGGGADTEVTVPENCEEGAQEESSGWQIEIDTGEAFEEQEGNDEIICELSAEIHDNISGKILVIDSGKATDFFSIIERAYDSGDYEGIEVQERYLIKISSSSGTETYSLSEDGYIMKNNDGRWKKIAEDKQQELKDFIENI